MGQQVGAGIAWAVEEAVITLGHWRDDGCH